MQINKQEYGLSDKDLGLVIVLRHGTGPFGFNESIWTKYGKTFAGRMSADVKAHPNPTTNVYAARITAMAKQGVHFAVCNLTTRSYARTIAEEAGAGDADAIYKDLTTNAVANAHFVPAGIVAVTRAQEYGFALVSGG